MNVRSSLIGAALVSATLIVGGCAKGATVSPISIGKSDKFCVDVTAFQAQAADLEAASTTGDLAGLQKQAAATRDALVGLQKDAAPMPDKVNGHLLRDDLATATSTYSALTDALNAAVPSDPLAVSKALASVQAKEGQPFTQATERLDAYTKKVCGLTGATVTTVAPTTAAPTTTVPVGPIGPGASTTAGPSTSSTAPAGSSTTATSAGETTTTSGTGGPTTTAGTTATTTP